MRGRCCRTLLIGRAPLSAESSKSQITQHCVAASVTLIAMVAAHRSMYKVRRQGVMRLIQTDTKTMPKWLHSSTKHDKPYVA